MKTKAQKNCWAKLVVPVLFVSALQAQNPVISEDFTTYDGTAATLAAGWTATHHGLYSTASSSGPSGPNSFKFSTDGAVLALPFFEAGDSVSFWLKGNLTDSLTTLHLLNSSDSLVWETVATLQVAHAQDSIFVFPVDSGIHYIAFRFAKTKGNMAVDDIRVFGTVTSRLFPEKPLHNKPGADIMLYGNHLMVTASVPLTGDVTVYDLTGRLLFSQPGVRGGTTVALTGKHTGGILVAVWQGPGWAVQRKCMVRH